MSEIMSDLRKNGPKAIGGLSVVATADYEASVKTSADGKTEQITLPKSNVITFFLQDNASVVIRPSGTEPKIRVMVEGEDMEAIQSSAERIADMIRQRIPGVC